MATLRSLLKHPERLSYYLTIYAVGIGGLVLAISEETAHPAAVITLIVGYMALASLNMADFFTRSPLRIHAALAVETLLVVALVVLAPEMSFFIIWYYLQVVYAIITLPRRTAQRWLVGLGGLTFGILVYAYGWVGGLTSAAVYASGFVFFWAFASLTRQAHEARAESERLLAELQEAHRSLQEYALKAETLAAAEERNRLAREMHDTIGHRLTVAAVQLEAAGRLLPAQAERAAEIVATVRTQVRAALDELRRTVAALRQPLEEALPLEHTLPRLVEDFRHATGLEVEMALSEGLPSLAPLQRLTIYRAVQEGLTNVHKHASARRAWVALRSEAGLLRLSIADDGRGPQENRSSGFGLRGLRERAARLGGEIAFGPRPGGGSLLEVTLPSTPPPFPPREKGNPLTPPPQGEERSR